MLNALRYEALESSPVTSHNDGAGDGDSLAGVPVLNGAGGSWMGKWAMRAGPRERIYFKPEKVKAAIVTCGGLCPGLNDVIRQLVLTLEEYGVEDIKGIRYGFKAGPGLMTPSAPAQLEHQFLSST